MTELAIWPGGYDPTAAAAGPVSPDAGPLAYDPAMSLYQAEPGGQFTDEVPADG